MRQGPEISRDYQGASDGGPQQKPRRPTQYECLFRDLTHKVALSWWVDQKKPEEWVLMQLRRNLREGFGETDLCFSGAASGT